MSWESNTLSNHVWFFLFLFLFLQNNIVLDKKYELSHSFMIISITRPFLVSILTVFMYQSLPASVRPPTPPPPSSSFPLLFPLPFYRSLFFYSSCVHMTHSILVAGGRSVCDQHFHNLLVTTAGRKEQRRSKIGLKNKEYF